MAESPAGAVASAAGPAKWVCPADWAGAAREADAVLTLDKEGDNKSLGDQYVGDFVINSNFGKFFVCPDQLHGETALR